MSKRSRWLLLSFAACLAAGSVAGRPDSAQTPTIAEKILSQISMSILKGKISTKGPGDDEDWTVYLLIRAPKSASLDLDTINGPISLYDVDGNVYLDYALGMGPNILGHAPESVIRAAMLTKPSVCGCRLR